jgi:primosomal protein N' (replication factor Y)
MVSKGFDFENLSLIVLVQADSMFATEDFRAQEKAMQMLTQLAGRGGRRSHRGHIMIQTSRPSHPVFVEFMKGRSIFEKELKERKEFDYPPYKRLIRVVLKHKDKERLQDFAIKTRKTIESVGITGINGPFPPAVDKVRNYHILNLLLRLEKTPGASSTKKRIYDKVNLLLKEEGRGVILYFDPDPL